MKIFICCSKSFYDQVSKAQAYLEATAHQITLPNSFDNPGREYQEHAAGVKQHAAWKARMLKEQGQKIEANDAILVLNYAKQQYQNYIGGATFLEMFKAFELGKKIFLLNDVPDGILRDEILGFQPQILNQDLSLVS